MRQKTIATLTALVSILHLTTAGYLILNIVSRNYEVVGETLFSYALFPFIFLPIAYLSVMKKWLFDTPDASILNPIISDVNSREVVADISERIVLTSEKVYIAIWTTCIILAILIGGWYGMVLLPIGIAISLCYAAFTLFMVVIRPQDIFSRRSAYSYRLLSRLKKHAVAYCIAVVLLVVLFTYLPVRTIIQSQVRNNEYTASETQKIENRIQLANQIQIGASPDEVSSFPTSTIYNRGRSEGDSMRAVEKYRNYLSMNPVLYKDDIDIIDGFLLKFKACDEEVHFISRSFRESDIFFVFIDNRLVLKLVSFDQNRSQISTKESFSELYVDSDMIALDGDRMMVCDEMVDFEDILFDNTGGHVDYRDKKLYLSSYFYEFFYRLNKFMNEDR